MKTPDNKITLTPEQARSLANRLNSIPAAPVGEHLTDEQYDLYSRGLLPDEEQERIDAHLASCSRCAEELGHLLDHAQVWHGDEGQARLARLSEQLLVGWEETKRLQAAATLLLVGWIWLSRASRRGVICATKRSPEYCALAPGSTAIFDEDEQGDLFTFETSHSAYNGALLRVTLAEAETGQNVITLFLVPHPTRITPELFVASARLPNHPELPEHVKIEVSPAMPANEDLLAAVDAAAQPSDQQAWHAWALQNLAGNAELLQKIAARIRS